MVTPTEASKLSVVPYPVSHGVSEFARVGDDQFRVQAALELVADYIRASGVRDPNKIAALANDSVRDARRQCEDVALEHRALRIVSARLGLACTKALEGSEESATEPTPASARVMRPEDVVPPCCHRVMPEQKLDELLPIAEPGAWRKLLRAGTTAIAFVVAKVRLV